MLIKSFQYLIQFISSHFSRYSLACLCLMVSLMPGAHGANLLVVGDSLSAAHQIPIASGWVKIIEHRVKEQFPRYNIINASISGDTTANGLQRFPSLLEQFPPSIVILELGGNDGLRGLPLAEIEKNLSTIIELAQQKQAKILLLGIQLPPNYGPDYTNGFAKIYPRLSEKYHLPLVPFMLEGVALNRRLMQGDGIHPNAEGQPAIADNIWPYLVPLLQEKEL